MRKITFALVISGVLGSIFLMLNQFNNARLLVSGADYRGGSSCFSPVSYVFCEKSGGGCASRICGNNNHCSGFSQSKGNYSTAVTKTKSVETGGYELYVPFTTPCYVMEHCVECVRSGNQSYCTPGTSSGPEPKGGQLVNPCATKSEGMAY